MELLPDENIEKPISFDILTYQAPFLIERLLKNAIVDDPDEGEQLFTEVKKWMLLVDHEKSKAWDMYSYRLDEVWHQFILFTDEYAKFCDCYFGSYFPHAPGNAPGSKEADQSLMGTFDEFKGLYQRTFNAELPDVWLDENSVTINRRILNDNAGKLFLEEKDGIINMIDSDGMILLSINLFARDAIAFIAATKAFYVRELPGDLTDEEKTMLIKSLVQFSILRVAF